MKQYILDENGEVKEEPDINVWAEWMAEFKNRRLALDNISEPVNVSTVFLSCDHQFDEGVPVLFETLISGGSRDQEIIRYTTKVEALEGHKRIMKEIQNENT